MKILRLAEKKFKQIKENEWFDYLSTIDEYQDDSLFKFLKVKFTEAFKIPLNETQLFNNSIVFGMACGRVGIDPDEKVEIDNLVRAKDRKSLRRWLQSTNVEKQIYGVSGFYQLRQKGLTLTSDELNMINAIITKKGTIYVCSGCDHSRQEIASVVKGFKF